MTLTVQIPTPLGPNASEEPKIVNTFQALSTWANGNIPDTDLQSPTTAVRRLILQSTGMVDDSIGAGDKIFTADSYPVASGAACYFPAPVWAGDAGLSSQPPDFQVANKTAYGRVRATLVANQSQTAAYTLGMYAITGAGGSGRGIAYTFATAYPGSTVMISSPAAGITSVESPAFLLPASPTLYALGVSLDSTPSAGSAVAITAQLYAYNA